MILTNLINFLADANTTNIMIWVWLGITVFTAALEALTPSDLVTIWFAAGAVVALIIAIIFPELIWLQILLFLIISITLIVCTRKLARRLNDAPEVKTNIDSIVGRVGRVTIAINPNDSGEVKCDGKLWTAISEESLEPGTSVEVLAVEGVKLVVKKYEE